MNALENESNRFVPSESYYVIRVQLGQTAQTTPTDLIAEEMLCSEPQPIAVYHCNDEVVLIFSCMTDGEAHQFGGDHHRIVSKYATSFARANEGIIDAKIIEFGTQTQIITYLGWIVFRTSQRVMKRLSNGKITDNLLYFRTEKELRDLLAEPPENIVWNTIDSSERYGTFIRLRCKRDKVVTVSLSEPFNAREYKRYDNFIFG